MDRKEKRNLITRRKFVKTVSTGAIGTTVLINFPEAVSRDLAKGEPLSGHQGKVTLELKVNGKQVSELVEPRTTLVELLRNHLGLTGTKMTCNRGQCGSCTVLLDGKAVYSCHILALDAAGREVTSVEGLLDGEELHPLQQAFIDHDGLQCGFCTPGQIMAARALLLEYPKPTKQQVLEGMAGNICRCAAYPKIIESVSAVSR